MIISNNQESWTKSVLIDVLRLEKLYYRASNALNCKVYQGTSLERTLEFIEKLNTIEIDYIKARRIVNAIMDDVFEGSISNPDGLTHLDDPDINLTRDILTISGVDDGILDILFDTVVDLRQSVLEAIEEPKGDHE